MRANRHRAPACAAHETSPLPRSPALAWPGWRTRCSRGRRVPGVSAFYLENALPRGGGHNVVNVILVDFRGFDTLGEITVVGIVALTVYKLLRRFRPAPESIELPAAAGAGPRRKRRAHPTTEDALPRGYMRAPAVLGSLLLPVASVVSMFFLLRGHDAPGGGFVGGLILSIAFIVQYMIFGTQVGRVAHPHPPSILDGGGPTFRGGGGCGAWLVSRNFLTSMRWDLHLRFDNCTSRARSCSISASICSWSARPADAHRAGAPGIAQPAPGAARRRRARANGAVRRRN